MSFSVPRGRNAGQESDYSKSDLNEEVGVKVTLEEVQDLAAFLRREADLVGWYDATKLTNAARSIEREYNATAESSSEAFGQAWSEAVKLAEEYGWQSGEPTPTEDL